MRQLLVVGRSPLSLAVRRVATKPSTSSVDPEEVARFNVLSEEWANEEGPFKALHAFNKLRLPWIRQNLARDKPIEKQRVVDVGSGGGLLSVPLARLGFTVSGVDASEGAVRAARKVLDSPALKAQGLTQRIEYHHDRAEDFAKNNAGLFDAVVASEIVEHVNDVHGFVAALSVLARPGAPLFFTTINKTLAARLLAVWMAEVCGYSRCRRVKEVLEIVPRGVHDWSKFVSPEELEKALEKNGCSVRAVNGLIYNPLCNEWAWTATTAINYGLVAIKE